jgi:hypothetical protein
LHFDATQSVLALSLLSFYRRFASTVNHPRKTPRVSFRALQYFRNQRPFFSLLLLKKRLRSFARLLKSSTLRVWLPSRRSQALQSLGNLFQSPTLLGLPLQSFALLLWSTPCLHQVFRSCTFLQNRRRLCTGASATFSHSEAVPLAAPRCFTSGRGPCSLGLSGLSGAPFASTREKASPFSSPPLVLGSDRPLSPSSPKPQGLFSEATWLSPSEKGAGLSDLLHRLRPPPLRKMDPPLTIFSSRKVLFSYENRPLSLCGRSPSA